MTSIQCRLNVDATSWRCIDIETTLYKRHVPAGYVPICIIIDCWKLLFNDYIIHLWFHLDVNSKNPQIKLDQYMLKWLKECHHGQINM